MPPRNLSLVHFDEGDGFMPASMRARYPFGIGEPLLFIGEIVNMPGHCIVANKKGEVHYGYHTENFIELREDEV